MRTRLIRPEFFSDSKIADLDKVCRLFYIGLWTLCDDDGYFVWELREIGAALFPYDPEPGRLEEISTNLASLIEIERVRKLSCGRHGIVPTLRQHRQKGGRSTFAFRDEHLRTCTDVRVRVVRPDSDSDSDTGTYQSGLKATLGEFEDVIANGKRAADAGHKSSRPNVEESGGSGRKVPPAREPDRASTIARKEGRS